VAFKFKNNKKGDVSFNLIAPLNALNLLVNNGIDLPDEDSPDLSSDGFIIFSKDQIDGLDFSILVRKKEGRKSEFVHFTIIASSSSTNLRLDPSVVHY
jgi:hypothetical protein